VRRAAAADANSPAIVAALRAVGASVLDLHTIGGGCPDLLAVFAGEAVLLEVKNPKGKNRIGERQERFRQTWRGRVVVVRSVDEALAAIGCRVMGTAQEGEG